jgi:hypothetical protein
MAVAIRLGAPVTEPSGETPYPGVGFADAVATTNPRKRQRKRATPRPV